MCARASTAPPFASVLELHGPALLRFCIAQAGPDRGEDVFQEAMIAALRAYGTLEDPGAVRAWLFSIAARKAIDSHRASTRAPVPVEAPEPPAPVVTEGPPDATRPGGDIWRLAARLPDKQRQALGLRFIADLSHREIGTAMGTSEAAARRNVFEALRRLRETLAEEALAAETRGDDALTDEGRSASHGHARERVRR